METKLVRPPAKLVPFTCPACMAPNEVGLVALARSGSIVCVGCKRKLSGSDVSRAMHTPRTEASRGPAGHLVSGQRLSLRRH